ncbi:MAG: type II toxin-antitoxin system RelE/ParE family toxin [Candidatus Uhrbacteria bacterium]
MKYRVVYHPLVVKTDIPKLDSQNRNRIKKAIEQKLLTSPEIFGVPLKNSLKGHRKLRVGDWRVVFKIDGSTITVFAIQHRSKVYENLVLRLFP